MSKKSSHFRNSPPQSTQRADSAATLRQAIQLHQNGHLDRARALYGKVLDADPENFDALHLSGVIAAQKKDPANAIVLIDRALRADGANPAAHAAHRNRGLALMTLGRLEAALASFDQAMLIQPNFAEAHCDRGIVLHRLRRLDAAAESFNQAVALRPQLVEAHVGLGTAYHESKRLDAALVSCQRAVELKPDYAEGWFNRGNVQKDLRQFEAALASYDRGLALKPDSAAAHANRGALLTTLGRWDAALASHDRAIALQPGHAKAHANRGVLLLDLQRLDDALASFDRAIAIDPEYANAHFNRSLCHLLAANWRDGWAGFEWRLKGSQGMKGPKRAFTAPRWCGTEPLAGKSIVIHSEQGLGDTIQFVRYAKLLANRGVAQVAATGDKLPPHDLHCPLLSLPLAFVAGTIAIPAEIPYIKADPQRVGDWKMRLGERRKPRVGIVWSGGFRPDQPELWSVNSRRNIPLQKLAPLKDLDIEFYSLQKGEPAESELKAAASSNWGGPAMHDFAGLLEDFADTAALIENLDLVVSVDTSTAHLAGAMGKPVWMLNRFDTCWRWLLHRCDTPWYPTMRLYRQATPGDWDTVVQRVKADLGAFQDGRSLPSSNDSTLG